MELHLDYYTKYYILFLGLSDIKVWQIKTIFIESINDL